MNKLEQVQSIQKQEPHWLDGRSMFPPKQSLDPTDPQAGVLTRRAQHPSAQHSTLSTQPHHPPDLAYISLRRPAGSAMGEASRRGE